MADGQIATRWLGVYSYDQSGSFPEAYVDTNFELRLCIGWFGRFRGTVLDAEPGILEPATIRGKLTADRITFEKRYGSLWVSDEFGNLSSVPWQQSYSIHCVCNFSDQRNRNTRVLRIWGEVRWTNGNSWELPATNETWTATPLTKHIQLVQSKTTRELSNVAKIAWLQHVRNWRDGKTRCHQLRNQHAMGLRSSNC